MASSIAMFFMVENNDIIYEIKMRGYLLRYPPRPELDMPRLLCTCYVKASVRNTKGMHLDIWYHQMIFLYY